MPTKKKNNEKAALTDRQKQKIRKQMNKERERVAKEKQREKARQEKMAKRYEKAAQEAREKAKEAREEQKRMQTDPKYIAKQKKEEAKSIARGKKEMEKQRKRSKKKAQKALKIREKENKKLEKHAKEVRMGKRLPNQGTKKSAKSARQPRFDTHDKKNIVFIIITLVVMVAAFIMLYPPDKKITQGLDIQGGVSLNLSASTTDGSDVTADQMEETSKVITARVNASGASAASVQQQGSNSFLVQVPGIDTSDSIINTLSSQGVLEFVKVDDIQSEDCVNYIKQGITGMNLKDESIEYTAFMTGDNVKSCSVSRPEASADFAVDLELDSEGAQLFGDVTKELVDSHGQIAILLDGSVQSAPAVQSAITDGRVQITGNFTSQEANDLKAVIDSGSLPVSLKIEQSSVVGPTLGQNALQVGILAGLIGLLLVILWLVLFYRGLGLVTGMAIVVMGIIYLGLLALLSYFGWFSLTLSGVAGIIVNIGLSADSSILILECFHEQVRKGRSIKSASRIGVHEGIWTSVDADVVTLVSALVLYFVSIGVVRGFGLTLALGIICDLVVMFLFSGPIVELVSRNSVRKHLGFWGMRDDYLEGQYVAKEVD